MRLKAFLAPRHENMVLVVPLMIAAYDFSSEARLLRTLKISS
jgi:hypothetical protein